MGTLLGPLTLLGGLAVLTVGAELLVRGASGLGRRAGMSELLIGLTLVAFGTSLPEFVVSLDGALRGSAGVALGNAVGSNAFNGTVILGLCALLRPLAVSSSTVWKEIPFSLLAVAAVAVLVNDRFLDGAVDSVVGRGDGLVLLAFFGVFLAYLAGGFLSGQPLEDATAGEAPGLAASVLCVGAGLALLVGGGNGAVQGAVATARQLGVSEGLIAVTILAGGTSLPELATSLAATRRGRIDLAVGNVVGSNVFNLFFVLGTAATIRPLAAEAATNLDLLAAGASGAVLFLAMFTGGRRRLDRWEGALLLVLYAAYLVLRYRFENGG